MPKSDQSICLQNALCILGDKWTPLIISQLYRRSARFGDLESALPAISPRTLSQRLDKLETEKILTKQLYCQRPPRYTYQLTKKGLELQVILTEMADWGTRHRIQQT
ncbi:MAG: helix-turn-helix domain-containing protein [Candidatus Saccharimonadales bacterium]